jgi:hypothetical protein
LPNFEHLAFAAILLVTMRGLPTIHPLPKHPHSEIYQRTSLLPELHTVGWGRIKQAMRVMHERTHPGYEICYLVSGSVDWWASDGTREVARGDVYITRPDERHGGVDDMIHPSESYWLIINIPQRRALPGMTLAQTRVLHRRFAALSLRCFPGRERFTITSAGSCTSIGIRTSSRGWARETRFRDY